MLDWRASYPFFRCEIHSSKRAQEEIRNLVEVPLGLSSPNSHIFELLEGVVGEINCMDFTTHALVHHLGDDRLPVELDRHSLSTVWVSVGLSTHQEMREGYDILGLTISCRTTSSKSGFVVRDVPIAAASLRTFTT